MIVGSHVHLFYENPDSKSWFIASYNEACSTLKGV